MLHRLKGFVLRQPGIVILTVLLGIGGFIYFVNIVEDVVTGDSGRIDRLLLVRASRLAHSSDGDWLTPLARAVSLLGNWQALIPLGLALAALAWRGRAEWRAFRFYALACAGGGAWVLGVKYLVGRPRPRIVPSLDEAAFLSFPSGHTALALVGWGFVAYLAARRPDTPTGVRVLLAAGALAITGLVGASRVYLAAHYPSDVAGGFLIAVPWLATVLLAFEHGRRGRPGGSSSV